MQYFLDTLGVNFESFFFAADVTNIKIVKSCLLYLYPINMVDFLSILAQHSLNFHDQDAVDHRRLQNAEFLQKEKKNKHWVHLLNNMYLTYQNCIKKSNVT